MTTPEMKPTCGFCKWSEGRQASKGMAPVFFCRLPEGFMMDSQVPPNWGCTDFESTHPTPAKEPSGELGEAVELAEMGYELSAYAASIHWSAKETNEAEWLVGLKERIVVLQGVYKHYRAQVTKEGGE